MSTFLWVFFAILAALVCLFPLVVWLVSLGGMFSEMLAHRRARRVLDRMEWLAPVRGRWFRFLLAGAGALVVVASLLAVLFRIGWMF